MFYKLCKYCEVSFARVTFSDIIGHISILGRSKLSHTFSHTHLLVNLLDQVHEASKRPTRRLQLSQQRSEENLFGKIPTEVEFFEHGLRWKEFVFVFEGGGGPLRFPLADAQCGGGGGNIKLLFISDCEVDLHIF